MTSHTLADLVFVGSGRTVSALDRHTGRPVWRMKLPRFFGGTLTLLAHEGDLFVGRGGYLYCLEAATGQVRWERGVASGSGLVFMAIPGATAGSHQSGAAAALQQQQQQARAAAAAAVATSAAASASS
jgi:outer membrane protein assembly factor BamB